MRAVEFVCLCFGLCVRAQDFPKASPWGQHLCREAGLGRERAGRHPGQGQPANPTGGSTASTHTPRPLPWIWRPQKGSGLELCSPQLRLSLEGRELAAVTHRAPAPGPLTLPRRALWLPVQVAHPRHPGLSLCPSYSFCGGFDPSTISSDSCIHFFKESLVFVYRDWTEGRTQGEGGTCWEVRSGKCQQDPL